VLPVVLGAAAHDDELAVVQQDFVFFAGFVVAEGEFARGAEAEGCDDGVCAQFGFTIAVPRHAFDAVAVAVEQAGVEMGGADGLQVLFNPFFQLPQKRCPRQGLAGDAGIGVGRVRFAVLGDLPGGGDGFAVQPDLVVPPGNVAQQGVQADIGFFGGENDAVIIDDAVVG
jgi:hypothetical protein